MLGQEAADLLVQAVNAARAERPGSPLAATEQMALRYFARANRFSRNEAALAEFQSISLSTATQIVAALVCSGYLKQRSANERGGTRFDLAGQTASTLAGDTYDQVLRAINTIDDETRLTFCRTLRSVLGTLVEDSAHWYLNSCHSCSELVPAEGPSRPFCKTFNIELQADDLGCLCINYNPRSQESGNEP